ncbi:MAG: Stp1/IreP family PP2C-type Ser/Thr phosphatase [Clostridia bacterium]|nr:Stp1/IreP family PP2C-type Ser/Thr phosphatase [Clostridia bacterium]
MFHKGETVTKYSVKSDKGIVRAVNQDSCFLTVFDDGTCFAVVCDGMGGPKAGDIAADIAIRNISERFVAGWRKSITTDSVKNLLTTSISAANICVFDAASADPELTGMGTTVVAAVLINGTLITAHVGDSRVYLVSDALYLITKDHSLVQELIDSGTLTREDAKIYPYKNVITRALGIDEHVEIEFTERKIKDEDRILLCSDGLSNYVSEESIYEIIKNNEVSETAELLIKTANTNGGGDNITAVVFAEQ